MIRGRSVSDEKLIQIWISFLSLTLFARHPTTCSTDIVERHARNGRDTILQRLQSRATSTQALPAARASVDIVSTEALAAARPSSNTDRFGMRCRVQGLIQHEADVHVMDINISFMLGQFLGS